MIYASLPHALYITRLRSWGEKKYMSRNRLVNDCFPVWRPQGKLCSGREAVNRLNEMTAGNKKSPKSEGNETTRKKIRLSVKTFKKRKSMR